MGGPSESPRVETQKLPTHPVTVQGSDKMRKLATSAFVRKEWKRGARKGRLERDYGLFMV